MKKFLQNHWAALLFVLIVGLSLNSIALISFLKSREKLKIELNHAIMELNDSDFKEGDRVRIPNSNFIGTVIELSNPISLEYIREMSTRGMRVIPVKWDNSSEISIVYIICLQKLENESK